MTKWIKWTYFRSKNTNQGKKNIQRLSLKEVISEIYNNTFDSLVSMQRLNIEEFSELNLPLNETKIEKQLKNKAFVYNNDINTNKITVHEYISIFMTITVKYIWKYKDSTIALKVKSELDWQFGLWS